MAKYFDNMYILHIVSQLLYCKTLVGILAAVSPGVKTYAKFSAMTTDGMTFYRII
jgi:hypothetical protein